MAQETQKSSKYKSYNQANLDLAVKAVNEDGMKIATAARKYAIPRKTLDDRIKGRVSVNARAGRKFYLSKDCDDSLADYLDFISKRGIEISRGRMRPLIRNVAKIFGQDIFCAYGPSDQWFRGFFRRHLTLQELKRARPTVKSTQEESGNMAKEMRKIVDSWFSNLDSVIAKLHIKPQHIYCYGEVGISGDSNIDIKVSMYDHVTCMTTASADGRFLPCMVLYKKSYPHRVYSDGVPEKWIFATSETGFVRTAMFDHWFEQIFLKSTSSERRNNKVLLIIPDERHHLSYRVVQQACTSNVELLYCPSNHTAHFSPMEAVVFPEIIKRIVEHGNSLRLFLPGNVMSRSQIPSLWASALESEGMEKVIKQAFMKCGIAPLSRDNLWNRLKSLLEGPSLYNKYHRHGNEEEEQDEGDVDSEDGSNHISVVEYVSSISGSNEVQVDAPPELLPATAVPLPVTETVVISNDLVSSMSLAPDEMKYCVYCQGWWSAAYSANHGIEENGQIYCIEHDANGQQPVVLAQSQDCSDGEDHDKYAATESCTNHRQTSKRRIKKSTPAKASRKSHVRTTYKLKSSKAARRKRNLADYTQVPKNQKRRKKVLVEEEYENLSMDDESDEEEEEEEAEEEDEDSDTSESEAEDVCNYCLRKVPQQLRNKRSPKIEWVMCTVCLKPFHSRCVKAKKNFVCALCS